MVLIIHNSAVRRAGSAGGSNHFERRRILDIILPKPFPPKRFFLGGEGGGGGGWGFDFSIHPMVCVCGDRRNDYMHKLIDARLWDRTMTSIVAKWMWYVALVGKKAETAAMYVSVCMYHTYLYRNRVVFRE